MRRLTLWEYRPERNVSLTVEERDAIQALHPGIIVQPVPHTSDRYDLTADHRIGLVGTPTLALEIRPKVPMSSVMFLLSYACEAAEWYDNQLDFGPDVEFTELVAVMLARLVERATRRGLLHGYQTVDEPLRAPRGRVLFDEQVRRRLGVAPPVEVRHDVYSADIIENRLLRSALSLLARMPMQSGAAARELARAQRLFGEVRTVQFGASRVPDVMFTRLNRHYQPALALATLVLRSASLDLGSGGAHGSALLINMNTVFEEFVRKALRFAGGLTLSSFPDRPSQLHLDIAASVALRPDLTMVRDGRIVWVGDAKYKRLPAGAYANADLYQMLAYCVTLGLDGGTLIYAADAGVQNAQHVVKNVGKRINVVALDLTQPRRLLLRQIAEIARSMQQESPTAQP